MSTSRGPMAMDSINSVVEAAMRLILVGLSSMSALPTVTVSFGGGAGGSWVGGADNQQSGE